MIFDCDTHLSPYRNFDGAIDAAGLDDMLASAGIDRSLIWLMPQGVDDVSESNRYVYDSAKQYPRFFPFGWSNVREGLEKALYDAKMCLSDYGFKGVKLNGAQNDYHIDCPEAMKVCEYISKEKGIIAFHIGADFPDNTSAARASNVAKAFPETTILMIHMGGAGEPDFAREVIDAAKIYKNMMLVGSYVNIEHVKAAIDELGAERVIYGSDAPFSEPIGVLKQYDTMLSGYDQEVKEAVMYKNAFRIFGL